MRPQIHHRLLIAIATFILSTVGSSCDSTEGGTDTDQSKEYLRLGGPIPLPSQVNGELVTASALGPDDLLVLGTSGGNVYTGKRKSFVSSTRPLGTLTERISSISIAKSGNFIAVSSAGGDIALARTGGKLYSSKVNEGGVLPTAFNEEGTRIAYGGFKVYEYEVETGNEIMVYEQPMLSGGRGQYLDLRIMEDGRVMAASVEGVDIWKNKQTAEGTTITCECMADGVALSDNGKMSVFGTADGHLVVVDNSTRDILVDRTVATDSNDHVFATAASSDGRLIVGIASSGAALIWDVPKNTTAWQGKITVKSPSRIQFVDGDRALLVESQTEQSDQATRSGMAPFLISLSS